MTILERLYTELYRLQAELDQADYHIEFTNLEEELCYIEGLIYNIEYFEE